MKFPSTENPPLVFVVDDDKDLQNLVCRWLENSSYRVQLVSSGEECLAQLNTALPSAILLDLDLPSLDGISTLKRIKSHHINLPVIMMTADVAVESVVTAMQSGAYDYLSKPLNQTILLTLLQNAIEKHQMSLRLRHLERENSGKGYEKIIGNSEPMKRLFKNLDNLVDSDITVLIQGASGTGKELVAQAIHAAGSRKKGPFIALNCAAIPETLHESELFGYEKGSFTGATNRKIGKFEQADGGTLFLDEVGEMSLSLQAKLLRVLQERNFQRLGGSADISVDFRLITASHVNLVDAVKTGKFRDDLYYRLAVFELEIPPLAERGDDISLIAQQFIEQFARKSKKPLKLSDEAINVLQKYNFPGNVRELQNALHRAAVVTQTGVIMPKDLPTRILDEVSLIKNSSNSKNLPKEVNNQENASAGKLESVEKLAIEDAIKRSNGNLSEAIRQLGIGRATFYRKLKKYGLNSSQ